MPSVDAWKKLEALANLTARWVAIVGLACLVVLALATIADVLMRWLFNSPIHGVHDLYKLVVAVVVGSFFPMALVERHHITIRFLGAAVGGRTNNWLNNFSNFALLGFLILMAWQLLKYVKEVMETGETTWILQWSVAPWWGIATLFVFLCIPIQLVVLVRDLLEPRDHQGHGHTASEGNIH